MNRIGEIGDPCGRPHWIDVSGPVRPSRRILTDRPVANDWTHWTRLFGQPCSRSLCTSLPGRTLSKAPLISSIKRVALSLLFSASSISYVRQVVRSTAERSRRAPKCWAERTCKEIASQAIFRAKRRSKPLPKTKRRVISL